MLRLTIVRHGETTSNVGNIIHTGDGGELTTRGICMARALGEKMKDETFTKIYVSDYKRAMDTLKNIISLNTKQVPSITIEPLLRERYIGNKWEKKDGKLIEDRLKTLGLPIYRIHTVEAPGSESYEHCRFRTADFFRQFCDLADSTGGTAEENILVVSHAWWIGCFFDYLIGSSKCFELVDGMKEKTDPISKENCPIVSVGLKDENEPKNMTLSSEYFDQPPLNTCVTTFSVGPKDASGQRKLTFYKIYDVAHYNLMK